MIAIYIIGGIVAYLLIGAVVAGVAMRIDKDVQDELGIVITLWPLVTLLGLLCALLCAANIILTKLAKFIGGVKD